MTKIPIRQFLKTPPPYQLSFPIRVLLSRYRALDSMYRRVLHRPWLKNTPAISLNHANFCSSYIGAVPHYRTGIGHILAEWNTGLLWSQKLGLNFAHCPLRHPWNEFFGFHGFEEYSTLCKNPNVRRIMLPPIPNDIPPQESPVIKKIIGYYTQKTPCLFQLYFGQNSYRHDETSHILQEKYFLRRQTAPIPEHRTPDRVNVSVHVRRRNAEDMSNPAVHDPRGEVYKSRYRESDFFMTTCQHIEYSIGAGNVHFNIFSQGSPSDFKGFEKLSNTSFFLNTDVLETFHNIVTGDILVLSPSSFSFKAGMISKGLKIAAEPWWHYLPDNSEWCRLGVDSEQNAKRIQTFLRVLKQ